MADQTFLLNGADGTAANVGNTGVTTVFVSTGGVANFSAAMGQEGGTGVSITNGNTTTPAFIRATADSVSLLGAIREYWTVPDTLPAAGTQLWFWNLHPVGTNNTRLLNLRIDSGGKVEMLDQSNAAQSATTHPTWGQIKVAGSTTTDLVLVAGTRYRLEIQWEIGTTTSNGYWAVQIYPTTGTTSTPLNNTSHASSLNTAANIGIVEWNTEETGTLNTGAVFTMGIDTITLRTGSRSPIGDYSVPTIDMFATALTPGSWTISGSGLVLSDADDATGYTSANNPVGSPLRGVLVPIAKPVAGTDLVCPLRARFNAGTTTANIVAKLYAPGGFTTLLATSATASLTGTLGTVNVTFTAASIAAITAAQFAGGLGVEILGTAS